VCKSFQTVSLGSRVNRSRGQDARPGCERHFSLLCTLGFRLVPEVLQPRSEGVVQRPLQLLRLGTHRVAVPRLLGVHPHPVLARRHRPDVYRRDALRRTGPEGAFSSVSMVPILFSLVSGFYRPRPF
jgi:hypothetical protein